MLMWILVQDLLGHRKELKFHMLFAVRAVIRPPTHPQASASALAAPMYVQVWIPVDAVAPPSRRFVEHSGC